LGIKKENRATRNNFAERFGALRGGLEMRHAWELASYKTLRDPFGEALGLYLSDKDQSGKSIKGTSRPARSLQG